MKRTTSEDSFLPPLWILTLIACGTLGWLLYQLKEIVVLLVVGYSIAYLVDPVLDWLETKKVSRSLGVFVIITLVMVALVLVALTVAPVLVEEYQRLSSNFPSYVQTAREKLFGLLEAFRAYLPEEIRKKFVSKSPTELIPNLSTNAFSQVSGGVLTALLSGYSVTLTVINLALLPFIVFYLAVDLDRMHHIALSIIPRKYQPKVAKLGRQIDSHVTAFVTGQLTVGLILFIIYTIGLGSIGVDLWLLLAFISGFGNLVPYVGFLTGICLSTIMTLVTFQSIGPLYYVWGLYAFCQVLEGFVLTPRIVGSKVGLSPLVVILAIFAGGKIFGLLGVFLAIPLAAALKVISLSTHRWVVEKI